MVFSLLNYLPQISPYPNSKRITPAIPAHVNPITRLLLMSILSNSARALALIFSNIVPKYLEH